jgi:hypothetical protein
MVTRQQSADADLHLWQSFRGLPPQYRIEIVAGCRTTAPDDDAEYQDTLNNVAREMANVA